MSAASHLCQFIAPSGPPDPHCGADPVFHHATQDTLGIKPLSGFCGRQKSVLRLLFELLDGGGEEAAVLRRWVSA
jgi:hypothetical protein